MNGQPESEQSQNFQERLSQWVSSQGFWFQLRYSLAGGGMKGAVAFHALRLATRLMVFLLVAAGLTWVFLVVRSGGEAFSREVSESLKGKLRSEEIQVQGLSREQGEFYVSRMAMTGGEDTFFTFLEARNLKCQMGLLDGLRKKWDPGNISIAKLDIGIRAGADSPEAAESMADVLFQANGAMQLRTISVDDASLQWGYSERTRGAIVGSKLRAEKLADGWRLKFRGGTFTQNWLKELEIVELDAVFGRQGVVFEKALFKKGQGFVSLIDLKVKAGERPEVSGAMTLRKVEVSPFLPAGVRDYLEGTISGQFKVFGSTNSTDGVGFEGEVGIAGDDCLVLRDKVRLLRSLDIVDSSHNYSRLDFREGSFLMTTHGGRMELSGVRMSAGEHFVIKGQMTVRLPTADEIVEFNRGAVDSRVPGILSAQDLGITLQRAGESSASGKVGFRKAADESLFARLGLGAESRKLEVNAAARLAEAYRYEGLFTITLPQNVFAKAPRLQEMFPGNGANGSVVMEVPIEGLISEITEKQAKLIDEKSAK